MAAERRAPRKAVAAATKPPDPPQDLQAAGRLAWDVLWGLEQIVYPADVLAVARLCRLEDEMAALRATVAEQGTIFQKPIQSPGGKQHGTVPVAHPALLALRRCGGEAGALCNALGIGVEARHSIGLVVTEPPANKVDELKAKRAKRRREMKRAAKAGDG